MARALKFCIKEEEGLYYLCSENKGADQLRGYREADLRLCFRICKSRFSHDEAQLVLIDKISRLYTPGNRERSLIFRKIVNDCQIKHFQLPKQQSTNSN